MSWNKFESGVQKYKHGVAVVDVYFPIDSKGYEYCCCSNCRLFQSTARKCALTGDVTPFPDRYVSPTCPLQWEDKKEDEDANK